VRRPSRGGYPNCDGQKRSDPTANASAGSSRDGMTRQGSDSRYCEPARLKTVSLHKVDEPGWFICCCEATSDARITPDLIPGQNGTEKRDDGARRVVDHCSTWEKSNRGGDAGRPGGCLPVPHADGEGPRGPDATQANLQSCPQRGDPSGESRPRRKARGRTAAKQTKDDLRDKRPDPWPGANVLQKCMEPTPRRKRQPVAQFADAAEPSLGIPNGRRTGEMTLAKRPHSILPRTG
jgi:hypothetical protein